MIALCVVGKCWWDIVMLMPRYDNHGCAYAGFYQQWYSISTDACFLQLRFEIWPQCADMTTTVVSAAMMRGYVDTSTTVNAYGYLSWLQFCYVLLSLLFAYLWWCHCHCCLVTVIFSLCVSWQWALNNKDQFSSVIVGKARHTCALESIFTFI